MARLFLAKLASGPVMYVCINYQLGSDKEGVGGKITFLELGSFKLTTDARALSMSKFFFKINLSCKNLPFPKAIAFKEARRSQCHR